MIQNNGIQKLKSKIQIDLIFKKGRVFKSGALIMHYVNRKDGIENTRIGVGVSKRFVHLAHRRNRIKRQIRAVINLKKGEVLRTFPPGLYLVLYKGDVSVTIEKLEHDFDGLLKSFRGCD